MPKDTSVFVPSHYKINVTNRAGVAQKERRKPVAGVGINDAPYAVSGHNPDGSSWVNYSYAVWKAVIQRCYSEKVQLKHPTYVGCVVDPRWHYFTAFRDWFVSQDGQEGYEIDKDLLSDGEKVYGPDTCVMVPAFVNTAVHMGTRVERDLPTGVSRAPSGKYVARIKIRTGKKVNIGCSYNTPQEASEAYKNYKKKYLQEVASTLPDRAKAALEVWISRNL